MGPVGTNVGSVLVCTVDYPAGYIVDGTAGLVLGSYAHPINRFLDQVKPLTRGDRTDPEAQLGNARRGAVRRMADAAADMGCNAVVGVRFASRNIGDSWVELTAYGTAVRLERA